MALTQTSSWVERNSEHIHLGILIVLVAVLLGLPSYLVLRTDHSVPNFIELRTSEWRCAQEELIKDRGLECVTWRRK